MATATEHGQEFEALDALFRSEGWARFKAYVAQQWGTPQHGGGARFQAAVTQAAGEQVDADATAKLRQVVVAQKQIQGLIAEFESRMERVRPLESRPELVGSRRGSL